MSELNHAAITFKTLFEAGSKAFKALMETAISPETKKVLREWGISEAAEMIGRSAQTLRNLEESEKIPKARLVQKGVRKERVYNLAEINSLRDFFGTRPRRPEDTEPAIIGFVNFKGGAGKTTSAISASQYFAKKGYRVLIIDCDSQGSATQMLGYIPDENFEEQDTILHVLIDHDSDMKSRIKKTYWNGMDIIPANLSLYNAELVIPSQIENYAIKNGKPLSFHNRLHKSLKDIQNDYDIIILDCPPSMGTISINAIFSANALIIELPPVITDFASTVQFFKMVSEVMERLPNKIYAFTRILITKYNGRNTAEHLTKFLKAFLGQFVMSNHMIESEAITKGAANMQTLYEIDAFDGDKRTYERAIQQADRVNEEIESLIKTMWNLSAKQPEINLLKDVAI
jgi:chromosome partitioning protein